MKLKMQFLGVFFVIAGFVSDVGAAGKASYMENTAGISKPLITEVDFIDADTGESESESENATYILKKDEAYTLVIRSKNMKTDSINLWTFGLEFSETVKGVFEIVSYGFNKHDRPAGGSPMVRRFA